MSGEGREVGNRDTLYKTEEGLCSGELGALVRDAWGTSVYT